MIPPPRTLPFGPAALLLLVGLAAAMARPARTAMPVRFEVAIAPGLAEENRPLGGRLFVALGRSGGAEPRLALGQMGRRAPIALADDVEGLTPDAPATLGEGAVTYPIESLGDLPAGTYRAQALLAVNRDRRRSPNAPGNLHGPAVEVEIDPALGGVIRLTLDRRIADDTPADTDRVKLLRLRSERLSAFHGRPFELRAAVILPRGFDDEPDRRYPLRLHIGGYGTPATAAFRMMRPGAAFRAAWDADDARRFVLLHLDGDGPLGDPYQVDSANHGPYGAAVTEELIPHVERLYRGDGHRVLDGGSTGGWVALALQVFYPDRFDGCWSSCPDPVDFRSYQLVNLYEDADAYRDADGRERASARDPSTGRTRYTIRDECRMENLLGTGGSYVASGGQWGAWNATFAPRGDDGFPVPLWDPQTGRIDREAVEYAKRYDLRRHLEANWPDLGPKLRGKIRIWVGESDDFFLDAAVHRLDEALGRLTDPPFEGSIWYGPGEGHCWIDLSESELLRQMAGATGAKP